MADTQYLQFHLGVRPDQLEALATELEPHVAVLWWDETRERLSGLVQVDQGEQFEQLLVQVVDQLGCGPIQKIVEPLKDRDWLRDQQKRLPPLPIGGFWLYYTPSGRTQVPPGVIPLFISDTGAFGSGHHITTAQCLQFLERLSQTYTPQNVADVGCGSGVLSLGVAALWKCKQVAGDIDPKSVLVARDNLRVNGATHVQTAVTNGFSHPLLNQHAPYDLILANILTDVVTELAPHIDARLTPKGIAILSGITAAHCDQVLAVYAQHGFHPIMREEANDWATVAITRT